MDNQLFKSAAWYQKKGYSVIPVKQNKKPFVKWERYQTEKADADQIRTWWKKWPAANIGLVTGEISGIDVVDCDSEKGRDALNEFLPDSLILPISKTPKGQHCIFSHKPGLSNGVRVITDCDLRTTGGYIIVPPSRSESGKTYAWLPGLSIADVKPAPMPKMLFDILQSGARVTNASSSEHIKKDVSLYKNKSSRTGRNISEGNTAQQTATNRNKRNISFDEPGRDDSLFHVAHCLNRGGMDRDNILKCLLFFGPKCNPPFPEKEIRAKIDSVFKRAENQKRNLTAEVREWVTATWGNISATEAQQSATNATFGDRKKIRVILGRLVNEGILERIPDKNGWYRKVEADCEPEDWQNASVESLPLWLPFGLDRIAEIQSGNIILIPGEPNAGKTAALMNIAKENMHKFKVHYFSSELGKAGFKRRVDKFPDLTVNQWKVNFYPRASNFADVIKPGEGNLNLIDYLEMYDNFYLVSKHLADIYNKLKGAIAVIGLQKNPGQDDGRGGSFTREKPVLSLALSPGRAKITKLKEWQEGQDNPTGKEYHFKLVDGCRFITSMGWHRPV